MLNTTLCHITCVNAFYLCSMKFFIFCILSLLSSHLCFSQEILVPYKVGSKFGLSDVNGKLLMEPAYDDLKWVGDTYFETSKEIILNDTLETSSQHFEIRKNEKTEVKGLIYNGKEILKDEPYTVLKVYPGKYIIGKNDERYYRYTKDQYSKLKYHERFTSLFNLRGTNLYPENFKRLEQGKILTLGPNKTSRFVMFVAETFDKKLGLVVFDIQKQLITQWLFKDLRKLKSQKVDDVAKTIVVTYEDINYEVISKLVNYSSGQFKITTIDKPGNNSDNDHIISEVTSDGFMGFAGNEPIVDSKEFYPSGRPQMPKFEIKNDSLFYVTDKNIYMHTPANAEFFAVSKYGTYQLQPMVYKANSKFGLITKDSVYAPYYDSLFYFGNGYMVGKIISGKLVYGVLDAEGTIAIPLEYDSIQGFTKQYEFSSGYKQNALVLKNTSYNSSYVNTYVKPYSGKVVVYKNGKTGILNWNNSVVIPVEYDVIASANFSFGLPRKSNYTVLKKNGKYGITELKLNQQTKQYIMMNTINPVFISIPCFSYTDYYNVKGFTLFGLYNEEFKFLGYADETGRLYYK
jgi:hypothetical protein